MNNAWLVRASSYDLFTTFKVQGLIAIGWSETEDLIGKSREQIRNVVAVQYSELKRLNLGNAWVTMDIFVNQMTVGDLVLLPSVEDVCVGVVVGNYYYDKSANNVLEGFCHQRKVEWKYTFQRKDLSLELRTYLRVHRTIANLKNYYSEISLLVKGKKMKLDNNGFIELSYPLRPDYNVTFSLPKNTTKDEAQRLSDYVKTLYFAKTVKELVMEKVLISTANNPEFAHLDSVITPLRFKYSSLIVEADDSKQPIVVGVKGHIGYLYEDLDHIVHPMHLDAYIELSDDFPSCDVMLQLKSRSDTITEVVKNILSKEKYQPELYHQNLREWFEDKVEPLLDEVGNYLLKNKSQIE